MDAPEPVADLSNPQRSAMERPLDTVRRLSQRSERRPGQVSPYSASMMPVDFMCESDIDQEELELTGQGQPHRPRKNPSCAGNPNLPRTFRLSQVGPAGLAVKRVHAKHPLTRKS
jgi:hypothetical protein